MALTSVVEACNNFLLALLAPPSMWLPASTDGHILSNAFLGALGPTVVPTQHLTRTARPDPLHHLQARTKQTSSSIFASSPKASKMARVNQVHFNKPYNKP